MNEHQALVATHICGSDAADFLQGYVTCDMTDMKTNRALAMAFPDRLGRILANGWLYGTNDDVVLVTHLSTVVVLRSHLKLYLQFSKSSFAETSYAIGISNLATPASVPIDGLNLYLGLGDQSESQCFELLTASNIALITEPTSGTFLPQMINLTDFGAVSFSKGCYLGQEVIARVQHRGEVKRRLYKYEIKAGALAAGQVVKNGNSPLGNVVLSSATHALVVASSPAEWVTDETTVLSLAA